MEKIFNSSNNLVTSNIYFGMYSTTINKQIFTEQGATQTISYTVIRFGILYKVVDGVYIDIIDENLISESKIDLQRFKNINELFNRVPQTITINNIMGIVSKLLNVESERDYIESAERNDNIKFGMSGSENEDIFEGFIEKCRNK